MSKWVGKIIIVLLCFGSILGGSADHYNIRLANAKEALQKDHVAQELLISMADSNATTLKNTLRTLKAEYHVTAVERLPTSDEQFRVHFATSLDLAGIIAAQDPHLTIEPNYIMHASGLPTDPYYASEQWYLHNNGQSFHRSSTVSLPGTAGIDIDWQPAFDQTNLRGEGTIVAIIDSGTNIDHPDLVGRIWTNPTEPTSDGVDNDANNLIDDVHGWNFVANNNQLADDLGHGNIAAGFIGAGDDTHGIVGVAPHTRIMPLKVLDSQGNGSTSNVIKAINYAVSHGANVINMSFGGQSAATAPLTSACNDANQAGVVLVAAAGNGNQNIENNNFAPASIPGVIAVGSIDSNGNHAVFSNTGNKLSLVAPGVFMLGTRANTNHEIANTILNDGAVAPDGYVIVSGTSFSAPLVSGAALLLREQNPQWSATQIQTQLESTARDLGDPGKDGLYGYGLVDIRAALSIPIPTIPTNTAPTLTSVTLNPDHIQNDNQDATILTVTATDPETDQLTVTASGSSINQDLITFTTSDNRNFVSEPIHVAVVAGTYQLSVHVRDAEHQVDQDISLVVNQAPISLTITGPTSNGSFDTTDPSITISGTTNGPIQTIQINNARLPSFSPGQNQWTTNQPLSLGANTITVDGYTFNNRLVVSTNIIVTRTPPLPTPTPAATETIIATPSSSPTPSNTPTPTTSPSTTPSPEPTNIQTNPPTPTTSTTTSRSSTKRRRTIAETSFYTAVVTPFYDIPATHFAYQQINDLHTKNSVQGLNGFYFPNNTISKGEFLKIALRDAGLITPLCSQTSVPLPYAENSSLKQELRCAYYYGLLQYEPVNFDPNQSISRSQAIVWLVSIRRTTLITSSNGYFPDVPISSWSPYINTAYQHQWVQGIQGLFYPNNTLTRAEAAKVIVNSRS